VANQNLGTEEDALNTLTLLLQDVRTRLVESANGTLSDADRATLSNVLQNARDSLMGIANTTDGNAQYLFSGSLGSTPAYGAAGNYQGDTLQREIQADQTRRIAGSDVGSDIFERAQPGTRAYVSYADTGNTGTAVLGQPGIKDNAGGNAAANYSFEINFSSPTTYTVDVLDMSTTPPTPVPAPPGSPFTLAPGATELDLGYGTAVQISGTPAAGDRFDVKPLQHENVNLFQTFDSVIAALDTPSSGNDQATAALRNVLNTAMQRAATSYDNVLTVRASVGARMQELTALNHTGTQRNLGYAKALSGIEDLDYYEATTQLSLRKMALEGAGLAFQTIQGLSLFNRNK
ncbi:MAG: flagellar hook-associated protein FlgL, partial [Castellaniella sp.]|uniref:flagellar hook-associated protein FlgL n=1 Tax=Castellaniella sp. TaxID=1955812 RepID=UPI002A361105